MVATTGEATTKAAPWGGWATVAICVAAALLEGYDIQSAGLAGFGLKAQFGLTPAQLGLVFSASTLGLLPGAALGGRLADRFGRKRVLIVSVVLFGLFSLMTAVSWSYESLLLARFLTGVGLGGAMPNLIALSAESVGPKSRHTAVAVMYAGMPLGGVLASLLTVAIEGRFDWHAIFYVGGAAPLLIAPLMFVLLPESRAFALRSAEATVAAGPRGASVVGALFGEGRWAPTLLLWAAYFFTLLVMFLLQNWLPSLIVSRGFSREVAGGVQIAFNLGGALGSLAMGPIMDRGPRKTAIAVIYLGLIGAMVVLGSATGLGGLAAGAFGGGLCALAGQMVLYGLAPSYYHTLIRGTGVGAAVAFGRFGSITGPVAAGVFLTAGGSVSTVLLATVPGILIAAVAAELLVTRRFATDWA
ncbi:MAG TPA: 3-(3-hydroxy-phenyl)propionate transporter MhpT [Caulobacteraceae bacterium]|jgi:AAHS family 3-hydroxyphenylpropionic acid transporter|nr:3-(3-hydroxy-phenyl)propionate transporter MhpT [Caulobacteraceae bacterium]